MPTAETQDAAEPQETRTTDGGKLVSILLGPHPDPDGLIRIVDGEREYTLRQVRNEVAGSLSELRRHGLKPGDRVLALLDHDPQAAFFLAAASALGLHLMMPYGLQTAALPEWRSIVTSARPDVVIHQKRDRGGVDALRELGSRVVELGYPDHDSPDGEIVIDHPDPIGNFLVLFSSGTTGSPKAISISESLIVTKISSVTQRLRFTAGSRVFMSGLMNNTTGVIFTFGGLLRGATVFFPDDREAGNWPGQVAARGATHIQLRPVALKEFVATVAATGVDLSCLSVLAYGGASVPRAVLEEGRRLIPGDWVQGYGLSETYGPFCWLDEQPHREQRNLTYVYCVGRPDQTVQVRIDPVEGHPGGVGEVLVRGAVMEGYLDVATGELRPPGAWFRTGDLGEWSPDGDLVLKGRISGALLTENGHRIYPEEIEAVLANIPGADDVVLAGLAQAGAIVDRPVACVCGPIGAQSPERVRELVVGELARSLSREKWPDLVWASAAPFPKSANGKIMRGEVSARLGQAVLIELSPELAVGAGAGDE
jgi:acyl-CoA synthetase (AMP-forming)/AMP-acid ligase II